MVICVRIFNNEFIENKQNIKKKWVRWKMKNWKLYILDYGTGNKQKWNLVQITKSSQPYIFMYSFGLLKKHVTSFIFSFQRTVCPNECCFHSFISLWPNALVSGETKKIFVHVFLLKAHIREYNARSTANMAKLL